MSNNPERSRLAQAARLTRQAEAQAAAGLVTEAVGLLKEALRLDPADRRALHRLGELHAQKLGRPLDAARYLAAKARCEEREGFETRAVASWRLAVRCDPSLLEGNERIGALYVSLGLPADARLHYRRSAEALTAAGRGEDAAILLAHLGALDPIPAVAAKAAPPPPPTAEPAEADDTATAFAADRMQSARLFHHYGLQPQAREQLEDLLKSLPEHIEARQLLVEVCRSLGDDTSAAGHLRVVTVLLRREAEAPAPGALLPVEEWAADEPTDPAADFVEDLRRDVERALDRIARRGGGR